jgi:hypothetical protein
LDGHMMTPASMGEGEKAWCVTAATSSILACSSFAVGVMVVVDLGGDFHCSS